jgi:chromosome segregation ATPase
MLDIEKITILEKENSRLQKENDNLTEEIKILSSPNKDSSIALFHEYKNAYFELVETLKNYQTDYLNVLNEIQEIKMNYEKQFEELFSD